MQDDPEQASMSSLVAQLRARRSLTQEELAREMGVSFSTVNAWEAGRSQPQMRHRRRLLELSEAASPRTRPVTVLLVDDSDTDLRVAARAVRSAAERLDVEVEIVTERDPLRALVLLGQLRPSITFVDVFMPVFDGFELSDRMGDLPGFEDVHLALVTAGRDPDVEAQAEARGLTVLDKPLAVAEVVAALRAALSEPVTPSPAGPAGREA